MARRLNFLCLIYGCFLFSLGTQMLPLKGFLDESIKIDITKALKKGNFLIGLKQYLGANSERNTEKQNIIFNKKQFYKP